MTTDFAGSGDSAGAIAVQTERKIVVAGMAGVVRGYGFAPVRYNN